MPNPFALQTSTNNGLSVISVEGFLYERARALLKEVAHESSDQIIKRFVSEGDAWAGARAQDDDVTFVVLKMIGAT